MTLNTPRYSTRSLSLLMLAAFAGIALWLVAPTLGLPGGSPSGGEGSPSRLPSMIQVDGRVVVGVQGDDITSLDIPITVNGEQSIDLTNATLRAETALAETALAAVPTTFEIRWTGGNGNMLLEPGEAAVLSVTLPTNSSVYEANPLDLVFVPAAGPTLIVEDVLNR